MRASDDCIAVIGPGAIGTVLAAKLRASGEKVLLLGRRDPVPRTRCAAVFLTVKSGALGSALRSAKRLAGPRTAVVSLLNGLSHAERVRRALGPERTVIGSCHVSARRFASGRVRHTGGRVIALAEHPGNAAALSAAAALLRGAGLDARVRNSERRMLWSKLVVNAAINPLGALTGFTNRELVARPAMRELVTKVLNEAELVGRAAGHLSGPSLVPKVLRAQARLGGQLNSMAQDIAAGRPTEADAILGPFLRHARRAGVRLRLLPLLLRSVKLLEKEMLAR
ncbi:MAG: 2-dehydropantoate 2-reductase [Elusimicrobiota bacterium]